MEIIKGYLDCTVIFIICLVVCCEGQQVNLNSPTTNVRKPIKFPKVPSCCKSRLQEWRASVNACVELDFEPTYNHYFFESNQTHIKWEKIHFNPTFFHQFVKNCKQIRYISQSFEVLGFISNGSILETNEKHDVYVTPPSKYCVNSGNDRITFVICPDEGDGNETTTILQTTTGQVYFPCLIVSTLCYFFSAIIYQFVLKVKDVHKKCFVGYCVCMGITFSCLILLQKMDTDCEVLGSIFFIFILASFVWLCCLCLDMVYIVSHFLDDDYPERIYLFIAASILIPSVMLVISIVPSGIPDVPNSFMKGQGMCVFKDTQSRISILFIPMGLLLFASLAALGYTFYLIRLNCKAYKSDISWLEKKSIFKYMNRSCYLIWLTTSIWVLDAALKNMQFGNPLVYEIIEGSQGIFVVAIFVFNRYTRKDLYKAIYKKNQRSMDSTRFNKLLENFRNDKNTEPANPSGSLPDSER